MNIKTDGKDLLESKTFVAVGLGETVVTIGAGQEMLSFVFDFVQDEDKLEGKTSMEWAIVDSKTLRVTLQNWNNSLGTTLPKPVEIGTYNNRRLFVLFVVRKVGKEEQIREFTFSTYLGEEAQGG